VKDLLRGFCLSATVLACVLSGLSAPASAQNSPPPAAPAPLPNVQPYPSPPAPAAPAVNLSPFAGITAFGQTLKDKGVYLQLGYVYDMNSLVSGGLKRGTIPTGELSFGAIFDLQTIMSIRGASFHITFDERSGFGLNGNVGTQGPLEANVGPTRSIRLSEFFWEQAFDDGKIDIRVGRTNPTLDFAVSDISCEFVSSIICSQPGSWYFSNNNDAYPASSWGGFLNIAVTQSVYSGSVFMTTIPALGAPTASTGTWNTPLGCSFRLNSAIRLSTTPAILRNTMLAATGMTPVLRHLKGCRCGAALRSMLRLNRRYGGQTRRPTRA
jgi:Carbohydrate-selective porin, OprB family